MLRSPRERSEPAAGEAAPTRPETGRDSGVLAFAYFFHLVVPALLLADVARAWLRNLIPFHLWSLDTAIAGLSMLWLVAALGLWLPNRRRPGFLRCTIAPLISIYTAYAMLILLEVALHFIGTPPTIQAELFSWVALPPGKHVFTVGPNEYPGVHGTKTVTINSLGLRGPMPPKREAGYRILAIGASTTACTILDDSEEWPHLLMENLNARPGGHPVWVGNAGIDGMTTIQHLILMDWLPGVVDANMAILLVGGTDLTTSLSYEGGPTDAVLERAFGFQKGLPPGPKWRSRNPLYTRLRLTLLIRDAVRNLKGRFSRNSSGVLAESKKADSTAPGTPRMINSIATKERRAAAPTVPLPDLNIALNEYRNRIVALADRCRDLEMRCLFVTHPALWRSDLRPADERLLWFGWVGRWEHPKGYVSAADLSRAMDAYNRTLLDVCRQDGLECYDLAQDLPKDTSVFFDDVHFNEGGAEMVAQNLARYLLSKPPLRP